MAAYLQFVTGEMANTTFLLSGSNRLRNTSPSILATRLNFSDIVRCETVHPEAEKEREKGCPPTFFHACLRAFGRLAGNFLDADEPELLVHITLADGGKYLAKANTPMIAAIRRHLQQESQPTGRPK